MATAAAPEATTRPEDDPRFDPTEEFPRPPDEDFWEKYSGRLEFPMSWTAAVLFHVLVFLTLFLGYKYLGGGDGGNVPVTILEVGGLDDEGEGRAGGDLSPAIEGESNPFDQAAQEVPPDPTLPVPKDPNQKVPLEDPNGSQALKEATAALNAQTNQNNKKIGAQKSQGNKTGVGPGGTGNDDKWKRGHRWRIRLKFEDNREYVQQLASAGAVIFVPDAVGSKAGTLFPDMNNPKVSRPANETGDPIFSGRLGMYEEDPKKVRTFLDFLGFTGRSTTYGVFFPKEFQEDLARKEQSFRNLRPDDIDSTVFIFVKKAGGYEVVVKEQQMRK